MFPNQKQDQEQSQQEEKKPADLISIPKPLEISTPSQLVIVSEGQFVEHQEEKTPSVPEDFFCPINATIMLNPVVAEDGNTYERDAIEEWFKKHNTSPLTGEVMPFKHVVLNRALRNMIDVFIKQHPEFKSDRHVSAPVPVVNQLAEINEFNAFLYDLDNEGLPPLDFDPELNEPFGQNRGNFPFFQAPRLLLPLMRPRNLLAEEKEPNGLRNQLIEAKELNNMERQEQFLNLNVEFWRYYFLSVSQLQDGGEFIISNGGLFFTTLIPMLKLIQQHLNNRRLPQDLDNNPPPLHRDRNLAQDEEKRVDEIPAGRWGRFRRSVSNVFGFFRSPAQRPAAPNPGAVNEQVNHNAIMGTAISMMSAMSFYFLASHLMQQNRGPRDEPGSPRDNNGLRRRR